MTYKAYNKQKVESILCEFTLSGDQTISSTSAFNETVLINNISGSPAFSLSNNIITLPIGYEYYIRFFVGIERSNVSAECYTKIFYSDNSNVTGATLSEITGLNSNKVSLEDTTCIIDASSGQKTIIFKTYKNSSSYNVVLKQEYCYGIILGIQK